MSVKRVISESLFFKSPHGKKCPYLKKHPLISQLCRSLPPGSSVSVFESGRAASRGSCLFFLQLSEGQQCRTVLGLGANKQTDEGVREHGNVPYSQYCSLHTSPSEQDELLSSLSVIEGLV